VVKEVQEAQSMRFIVRKVRPRNEEDAAHEEYEEFRKSVLGELLADEYDPFWDRHAQPASTPERARPIAHDRLIEMLSILCVA
jgi:hypothetical protein